MAKRKKLEKKYKEREVLERELKRLVIPNKKLKQEAESVGLEWRSGQYEGVVGTFTDKEFFMKKFGEQAMLATVLKLIEEWKNKIEKIEKQTK